MNTGAVDSAAVPDQGNLAGLEPIEKIRRRWPMWLGAALSLLMVAGLGHELFDKGLAGLSRIAPTSWVFYVVFVIFYVAPPTFDYLIFRRLWGIPLSGMIALHKKRIANDVVLGYSGEAYFYAWARQRTQMVAAPFGAVKDVSILSAIAGNAITLAMMAFALPLAVDLLAPGQFKSALVAVGVMVAMSLPFLIFSKRVFSLPRGRLWWIFNIHCLRIVVDSALLACAWYFAMPDASLGIWMLLAVARLLVQRLPFLPNKDLLFVNFAIIMIGQGQAISELLAFMAALTLLGHAVLILAFAVISVLRKEL